MFYKNLPDFGRMKFKVIREEEFMSWYLILVKTKRRDFKPTYLAINFLRKNYYNSVKCQKILVLYNSIEIKYLFKKSSFDRYQLFEHTTRQHTVCYRQNTVQNDKHQARSK